MTIARTLLASFILVALGASQALAESDEAAAVVPPKSEQQVVIVHRPLHSAALGKDLRFVALVDNDWKGSAFVVRYRHEASGSDFAEISFERSSSGGYFAQLPGEQVKRPGLEYYIASKDLDGEERLHFASSQKPHRISVDIDQNRRWSQEERRRLRFLDSVDLDIHAQDFGNRYGKRDALIRSEIRWSHKILQGSRLRLYSIHLGFGAIEGKTPESEDPDALSLYNAARYGFGGIRLQVTPSISATGETLLGIDRDEVIAGIRGEVTFGKRWQSNLSMGAEHLQHMGPSVWMRLQWDTVPPLLMAVSLVKTDLPDATLSGGTYSAYEVEYPLAERFKLRARVSFGSRDGPGRVGAGFGTSLAF